MAVSTIRVRVANVPSGMKVGPLLQRIQVVASWDLDRVEALWFRRPRPDSFPRRVAYDLLEAAVDHDARWLIVARLEDPIGGKFGESDVAIVSPGETRDLNVRLIDIAARVSPEHERRSRQKGIDLLLQHLPVIGSYGAIRGRLVRPGAVRRLGPRGPFGLKARVHVLEHGFSPSAANAPDPRHAGTIVDFGPDDTSCDWVVTPIGDGAKRVLVSDPASGAWEATVRVKKGEMTDLGDIALQAATGQFRLRVRGSGGEPLTNVFPNFWTNDPVERSDGTQHGLWLGPGEEESGGEIVLRPVPPYARSLKIDLFIRGYAEQTVTVPVEQSPYDVQLQPVDDTGRITGVVVDTTGAPIEGAMVIVKGMRTGVMTDIAGKFHIPGIRADAPPLEVLVFCAGFKPLSTHTTVNSLKMRAVLERE